MNTKRSFQIKKFIGDRAFYKRYLMLALPMILQNAITNLVSFLDNIMVGQLGTEQMSGVAIVNQLIFVYNLAIFGAASAASIFGAQYFGKGNHEGHMYSFRFKLYATMFVTILAITLFITNGENLISLYLTDTAGTGATDVALRYGKQYLSIMLIGLVPFAVTQSYATNIKETGQTFVPMVASFVAVGSNAVLDYLLIFGIGPFPKLGVMGAALATILARYIEAAIIVIWAHSHKEKNKYLAGAYRGFGMPMGEFKAILIKGFPLMLNELLWAAGMTAVTQCYSVRGLEVVAGHDQIPHKAVYELLVFYNTLHTCILHDNRKIRSVHPKYMTVVEHTLTQFLSDQGEHLITISIAVFCIDPLEVLQPDHENSTPRAVIQQTV